MSRYWRLEPISITRVYHGCGCRIGQLKVNNNLQYVDENTSKANHLQYGVYNPRIQECFSNELINKFVH